MSEKGEVIVGEDGEDGRRGWENEKRSPHGKQIYTLPNRQHTFSESSQSWVASPQGVKTRHLNDSVHGRRWCGLDSASVFAG